MAVALVEALPKRARLRNALWEAAGAAIGANPISFLIPCHRAIAKDGRLTGYEALLREGVIVRPMARPLESWIRVTVGLPDENQRFLDALDRVLRESRA